MPTYLSIYPSICLSISLILSVYLLINLSIDLKNRFWARFTHTADCEVYRESGKAKHPAHFNVLKSSTTVNDPSAITLVTHLTSDRYDRVISIMDTWKGKLVGLFK